MKTTVTLTTLYPCSLDRAFKTPMLCDISKVHTGLLLMPRFTHCTEDAAWGKVGATKKVHAARSPLLRNGFILTDQVVERIENRYWKLEVSGFPRWMLGFSKFTGEWQTTEIEKERTRIDYAYTLHSNIALLYPLQWLFAHTFWRLYMKQILRNVKHMAIQQEPYIYH
jgi:hypothetical protein